MAKRGFPPNHSEASVSPSTRLDRCRPSVREKGRRASAAALRSRDRLPRGAWKVAAVRSSRRGTASPSSVRSEPGRRPERSGEGARGRAMAEAILPPPPPSPLPLRPSSLPPPRRGPSVVPAGWSPRLSSSQVISKGVATRSPWRRRLAATDFPAGGRRRRVAGASLVARRPGGMSRARPGPGAGSGLGFCF